MVPGDPLDPKTRFGSVSSKKQLETVLRYIESGRRRRVARRRERADIGTGKGYFVQPTVFADVTPEMTISREEIRPVLAAIESPISTKRSPKRTPRNAAWPRACGRATSKAHYVARKLQAGTV
jgi:hypothetical protein